MISIKNYIDRFCQTDEFRLLVDEENKKIWGSNENVATKAATARTRARGVGTDRAAFLVDPGFDAPFFS